jgi:hypothetical protein
MGVRNLFWTGKTRERFEGSGFLVMNFCSQLPELHVIMYVSSLRVLTYDCAFVHMNTQQCSAGEKRTYAILLCQWECLDLRIQSSIVILLSSSHFRRLVFSFNPCPQTCWSTRVFFVLISLSWLLRTFHRKPILMVLLTTFWKIKK